jgi:excisionase family DNA binding protein
MSIAYTPSEAPVSDQLNNIGNTQEKLGGLGRTRVFDLIRTGQLKSVKIGRRRLVPDSAIAEYIESLKATA